jgi:hypothetical protein
MIIYEKMNVNERKFRKHSSKKNGRGCHLSRCVQHIFNEDPVAGIRVVYKDVGDGADEFAILDYWAAAHADVK